ncbi:ATP-binding protein [soil metagenome]
MNDLLTWLRSTPSFSELDDEALEAIVQSGEVIEVESGRMLFAEGDPGDRAYFILEGMLEVTSGARSRPVVLATCGPGELIGESALIRDLPRNASVTAQTDARLLAIGPSELRAALATTTGADAVYQTLLDRLEKRRDRIRTSERMSQLGTLAAGVAHELNNPSAAIARSARLLDGYIERLVESGLALDASVVDATTKGLLTSSASPERGAPPAAGPLERADREAALEGRLAGLGVDEPWRWAAELSTAGFDEDVLEEIALLLPPEMLEAGLGMVVAAASARRLASEIGWAADHIAGIVSDLSSYSHLGQAPVQTVDVVTGVEKALTFVAHRLDGITVEKHFEPDVGLIVASGGELNQVWTNLVANAADAVGPGGRIVLRARSEDDRVLIEVEDDGPGISESDLPHVFDAFFTTKPPGKGVGLGLSISQQIIVGEHGGELTVESQPGRTLFTVTLPRGGTLPV